MKIAILGSTGSIGKTLLNLIFENRKKFEIILLTANKNYKSLLKQAKLHKVRNIVITDYKSFLKAKNSNRNKKLNIYNDFSCFNNVFKTKVDYVMSSIIGLDGLMPTLKIIKFTKKIAIANKASILCGLALILALLKKNTTNFIPVDSEHFSIWDAIKFQNIEKISKVFITASGGPFLYKKNHDIKNAKISHAIKHPNWKMGKKISVDSATMMNKVFEVIETKKIFNIRYKKISILIHPNSYIHAIVKFNNGIFKIIAHDTTMKIPIFNSVNNEKNKIINTNKLDLVKLNNLNLSFVNDIKFKLINIIKILPENSSLFETVLVSLNDELVSLFLKNKIKYHQITDLLLKLTKLNEFQKYKRKKVKKIEDIIELNKYVRLKVRALRI